MNQAASAEGASLALFGCDTPESLQRALPAPPSGADLDNQPDDVLLLDREPRIIEVVPIALPIHSTKGLP